MPKSKLAAASTEAQEARWFEQNQDRILRLFEQAAEEGALRIGGKTIGITISKRTEALVKPPTQKVMLRIPADDLQRARRLASRKGLGYQTYMKMLLHESLDRAERAGT
jgi:hypothetical protein